MKFRRSRADGLQLRDTDRPGRRHWIAIASAGAPLVLLLWWMEWIPGVPARINPRPLNVIVITADTLRADKLGAYGNTRIATPNIDRLASEGVLFEQATTVVPLTLPAHASIFTGTYPLFHGVRDNGGYYLDPAQTRSSRGRPPGWTACAIGGSLRGSISTTCTRRTTRRNRT